MLVMDTPLSRTAGGNREEEFSAVSEHVSLQPAAAASSLPHVNSQEDVEALLTDEVKKLDKSHISSYFKGLLGVHSPSPP